MVRHGVLKHPKQIEDLKQMGAFILGSLRASRSLATDFLNAVRATLTNGTFNFGLGPSSRTSPEILAILAPERNAPLFSNDTF